MRCDTILTGWNSLNLPLISGFEPLGIPCGWYFSWILRLIPLKVPYISRTYLNGVGKNMRHQPTNTLKDLLWNEQNKRQESYAY